MKATLKWIILIVWLAIWLSVLVVYLVIALIAKLFNTIVALIDKGLYGAEDWMQARLDKL